VLLALIVKCETSIRLGSAYLLYFALLEMDSYANRIHCNHFGLQNSRIQHNRGL